MDPAGRRPVGRRNSPRRRAKTRRIPTIAVRAASVVPISGAGAMTQLGRPHEPRQPALGVPRPAEPEIGRVLPGKILGVAHEARRPEPAVRPRLVEPDPVASSATRLGRRRAMPLASPGFTGRPAGRASRSRRVAVASCGAVCALEPDLARALGVEHDDRRDERLVLVGGVRPRVVELVEDVGVDPARAPLAVDRLGRAGRLDRHVVRVDLRPHAVEQDPPLAPDGGRGGPGPGRRRTRTLGQRLDDRAAELGADLLAALGDLEGCREDRLAALALGSGGRCGRPNSVGNIARQVAGRSTSPFITARARIR